MRNPRVDSVENSLKFADRQLRQVLMLKVNVTFSVE